MKIKIGQRKFELTRFKNEEDLEKTIFKFSRRYFW